MQKPKMVGINHVALEVGDIEEALAFYGRIFDFTLRGKGRTNAFIDMGDQFINLMQAAANTATMPARHFGLVVDDRSAVRALVKAAGGEIAARSVPRFPRPLGQSRRGGDYGDIQFTKAPHVLRGMGLELDKTERRGANWPKKAWHPTWTDTRHGHATAPQRSRRTARACQRRFCSSRSASVPSPPATVSSWRRCARIPPTDGLGDDWHVQHLGARAMGGAGIVFTEATHVSAIGRITHHCLGLWNAQHQALLTRLAAIITRGGAVPGIQLAHAGRKASTTRTWEGSKPIAPRDGGWVPVAPSPIAFHPGAVDPHALTAGEIADIATQFATSARMACEAGMKVVEIYAAHGYLLHSFLSPISNHRNDGYGGDLDGRSRFLMETVDAVRTEWPADLPLFVRLSCVDYLPGGLTIDDTVALCRALAARGDVDLIDCSSGGISPDVRIPRIPAIRCRSPTASGVTQALPPARSG